MGFLKHWSLSELASECSSSNSEAGRVEKKTLETIRNAASLRV